MLFYPPGSHGNQKLFVFRSTFPDVLYVLCYSSTYRTNYRPTYRASARPTYMTSYMPTYRTTMPHHYAPARVLRCTTLAR